jgi:hypothetical protein
MGKGVKEKGGKNTAFNFLTISYEKPIPKIAAHF